MNDLDDTQDDRTMKFIRTYAKDFATYNNASGGTVREPSVAPTNSLPVPDTHKSSPWQISEATRDAALVYNKSQTGPPGTKRINLLETPSKETPRTNPTEAEQAPPVLPIETETLSTPPVFVEAPPPPPPIPPVEKTRLIETPPRVASSVHTFATDFKDKIDQSGASRFTVLATEADTKPTKQKPRPQKSLVAVLAGALLLIAGTGGVIGAYWYIMTLSATPASPIPVPSLVFADERIQLVGEGSELLETLATTANQPLVDGNVLITYLSEATTTPKGERIEIPLAGGALIRALMLPAPDLFLRNVAPASTVGIIRAGLETRPFFVFRVTSYERTFAGMLAWEATIGRDLEILYPAYSAPSINQEATVIQLGTSTPVVMNAPPTPLPYFTDAVVESHDVRKLTDTDGTTLLLYGYADKETLILARDEKAFGALLGRLYAKP